MLLPIYVLIYLTNLSIKTSRSAWHFYFCRYLVSTIQNNISCIWVFLKLCLQNFKFWHLTRNVSPSLVYYIISHAFPLCVYNYGHIYYSCLLESNSLIIFVLISSRRRYHKLYRKPKWSRIIVVTSQYYSSIYVV